jgi:SAM-dependent methyltransferase
MRDAKTFWAQGASDDTLKDLAHWRHVGRWSDDAAWLEIGKTHYAMIHQMLSQHSPWQERNYAMLRVVDFGCGGGANALELCRHFGHVYGVDISEPTLTECRRQVDLLGLDNKFIPILIPIDYPEDCLDKIGEKVHIFLSTAVYQHFPSKQYGVRVTELASNMLTHPGFALIQIRYDDADEPRFRPKKRNYCADAVTFMSYRSDEFAAICRNSGFEVLSSKKVPEVNYDYFFLCRR